MIWQRKDIIQVSTNFIPYSNFITDIASLNLSNISTNIKRKPQRTLQNWEYVLSKEGRNIIKILERDQLSSPTKFEVLITAGEEYMRTAYNEFLTVYNVMSFEDFCLFPDFVNKNYPDLFTTYYLFNNKIFREDAFFCTMPPKTEFYIGSVFEY